MLLMSIVCGVAGVARIRYRNSKDQAGHNPFNGGQAGGRGLTLRIDTDIHCYVALLLARPSKGIYAMHVFSIGELIASIFDLLALGTTVYKFFKVNSTC